MKRLKTFSSLKKYIAQPEEHICSFEINCDVIKNLESAIVDGEVIQTTSDGLYRLLHLLEKL